VAQAILHEPDIVILDEPTNGLDPTQIRHMRELIGELAQTATVIVSTHILQEVQATCERVLILRAGRLVVDARIEELRQSPALLVVVGGEAEAVLKRVDGVTDVRALANRDGRRHYRIEISPDAAPRLAAAVQAAGLDLFELQPERHDLETVFARVNEAAVQEVAHG
jgi:ABC-2 type transport system ATP-binding protein